MLREPRGSWSLVMAGRAANGCLPGGLPKLRRQRSPPTIHRGPATASNAANCFIAPRVGKCPDGGRRDRRTEFIPLDADEERNKFRSTAPKSICLQESL